MPINKKNPRKEINHDNTRIKKMVKDNFKPELQKYKELSSLAKNAETSDKQIMKFGKMSANCILLSYRFDALYSKRKYVTQKSALESINNLKQFIDYSTGEYYKILKQNAELNSKALEQNKTFSKEFRDIFNDFVKKSQKIMNVEDINPLIKNYKHRMVTLLYNKIRSN